MADDLPERRLCRIEQALGHRRTCPEERCAFWERGDEHRTGWCVLEEVDLSGRHDLAQWLTRLREKLESDGGTATG